MTVNEWDSPTGETLRQLKVNLKRKNSAELILPARTDGPTFKTPKKKPISKDGSLFVVKGDEQAPHIDKKLHEAYCNFLADNESDINTIIDIGDAADFPTVSKYKSYPEMEDTARVNDCITGVYQNRRDERTACPEAEYIQLPGNHDIRLRDFVIANTPELHGLKRAEIEGQEESSVFSLEFLMRLDELGIKFIETNGPYEHGEYRISDKLAARHGDKAVKGSGSTALKTLEQLGYSILIGHTHRQSLVYKTSFDINGEPTILCGAEIGAMCIVENTGLGYGPHPDWQPGFSTVIVWPDGKFRVEHATFVNGNLLWRDKRY